MVEGGFADFLKEFIVRDSVECTTKINSHGYCSVGGQVLVETFGDSMCQRE